MRTIFRLRISGRIYSVSYTHLDSVENAAASKPNIDKFITRFARVYTPFVVFFALFVAIVLPFILPDSLNWHLFVDSAYTGTVNTIHGTSGTASIYTALTFLVISCPCACLLYTSRCV